MTATWWAIPSSMRLTCRPTVAPGRRCWKTAVTGKTTSGYERSHRIDLPHAGSTGRYACVKSPDANSVKVGDVMTLQSYTEVIDAKLRYPNTALLYIEFDSSQFNGSIPQISCEPRGRMIQCRITTIRKPRIYRRLDRRV